MSSTSILPAGVNEASPELIYTPEALADIWVASYRFSQGSSGLQANMIGFLCNEVIPDSALEDQPRLDESFELAREKAGRINNSYSHVDGKRTTSDAAIEEDFQVNVIDEVKAEERKASLKEIVKETLRKDATYSPANGAEKRTFASAERRYFSYAVRYILLQKSTRLPAVNYLLTQAQLYLAPLAAEDINTYEGGYGDMPGHIRNTLAFNDILLDHLNDNPRDIERIQTELSRLGISQPEGYRGGELLQPRNVQGF